MSLWSTAFLIGHFILFILTPGLLVPYIDRLHSLLLCKSSTGTQRSQLNHLPAVWLRPSKQIHAPIFNIKLTTLADYQIRSYIPHGHRNFRRLDRHA